MQVPVSGAFGFLSKQADREGDKDERGKYRSHIQEICYSRMYFQTRRKNSLFSPIETSGSRTEDSERNAISGGWSAAPNEWKHQKRIELFARKTR